MKKLTNVEKGRIYNKADSEGHDYYICHYGHDFMGTEYEQLAEEARIAMSKISAVIDGFEQYAIEDDGE